MSRHRRRTHALPQTELQFLGWLAGLSAAIVGCFFGLVQWVDAAQHDAPVAVDLESFRRSPPDATWLRISGGLPDYSRSFHDTYEGKTDRTVVYIPLRTELELRRLRDGFFVPADVLVATRSEDQLRRAEVGRLVGPEFTFPQPTTFEGVLRFPYGHAANERPLFAKRNAPLEDDYVILEHGGPTPPLRAFLWAGGGLLLGLIAFARSRPGHTQPRRVHGEWPPRSVHRRADDDVDAPDRG